MKTDAAMHAAQDCLALSHKSLTGYADIIRQHTRPDLGVELAQHVLDLRTTHEGSKTLARQYLAAVGEEE